VRVHVRRLAAPQVADEPEDAAVLDLPQRGGRRALPAAHVRFRDGATQAEARMREAGSHAASVIDDASAAVDAGVLIFVRPKCTK